MSESNLVVEVVDNRQNTDIVIEYETLQAIIGKPALVAVIVQLHFFAKDKDSKFTRQKQLAEKMGFTEPTFKLKRDELVALGILSISTRDRRIKYTINSLDQAKEAFTLVQELVKPVVNNTVEAPKPDKFPNQDYIEVQQAFEKAKGIRLAGPEIARLRRTTKMMFQANRNVQQIVACVFFFKYNQHKDQFRWMQNWTLETVMKKIPEFVAGTLKAPEIGDDLPNL